MLILDLSQPVVCSMTGRMRQEKGWGNQHRHFFRSHLFVFVTNGTATFEIGAKSYRVSVGDIILVPANTDYVNGRKLEYAIELMKNTSLNITQIPGMMHDHIIGYPMSPHTAVP